MPARVIVKYGMRLNADFPCGGNRPDCDLTSIRKVGQVLQRAPNGTVYLDFTSIQIIESSFVKNSI
ncbi:hypothetical protein D3C87_2136380 [compost metagenome]